jgi:peptidoglycan/LPS O-acetylase OafA/YrhL
LLRAAAIISVLGFHLRPEYVPQGYLGVDIFFAISGYLMTIILHEKPLSLLPCLRFYERRLKRLLPAYLLIVFLTLAITSFYIISTDYDFLKIDTTWSMAFVTNFQSMFKEETYFLLISEYKFLLHTWSLSVEIQYYLFAPFILIPISWSSNSLIPLVTISGLSWAFQTFIPYPTISFGFVFSRIWQFLIGSIAFYVLKEQSSKLPEKSELMKDLEEDEDVLIPLRKPRLINYDLLRFFNFVAIFVICFMPKLSNNEFYESLVRLISTMLGGISIFLGAQSNSYGGFSLFAKAGTYLGDISYSVYLIHWPVIILAKYLMIFEITPLCHILAIIFAISMAQYHLFEKPLLHQSSKLTFSVCGIIYGLLILTLCQPQSFGFVSVTHPAVAANQQIAERCNQLEMNKDCNWDPEMLKISPKPTKSAAYFCSYNGTGKATVFFTGNSYALRQLAGVKKALKGKYKTLYFAARPACLTFETFNDGYGKYWQCDEIFNKTVQFLEKFKPDLLIISQKVSGNDDFKHLLNSTEAYINDNATIEVARYFQMFSTFTQKIFVIEPHPTCSFNPALKLAKEIALDKNISIHNLELKKVRAQVDPGWLKIKAAMKDCPKCVPIDIRNDYVENGRFAVFDTKTKLSLFCDNNHLSPPGVERMLPTLKKSFNQALAELNL